MCVFGVRVRSCLTSNSHRFVLTRFLLVGFRSVQSCCRPTQKHRADSSDSVAGPATTNTRSTRLPAWCDVTNDVEASLHDDVMDVWHGSWGSSGVGDETLVGSGNDCEQAHGMNHPIILTSPFTQPRQIVVPECARRCHRATSQLLGFLFLVSFGVENVVNWIFARVQWPMLAIRSRITALGIFEMGDGDRK